MNVVNKNLEVRIYPSKVDKNDKGEKIANLDSILSNIGISRFIFNQELAFINNFRRLLVENGYESVEILRKVFAILIPRQIAQNLKSKSIAFGYLS